MTKTVVIHQPDFLSYLGFLHRLLYADLYVILDDVQFVKGTSQSWMNRDKIKTPYGDKWLTLNVQKASKETLINKILLDTKNNWKEANLNLLYENYKKTDFFDEIFPYIEALYAKDYEKLVDINTASISMLLELFDIKVKTVFSSNLITTKTKSERLVEILKQLDATHYLSGIGAKSYHDETPFKESNITVLWQDFKHPTYPQQFDGFIPYLSSVDLLFNCGIENSRKILREI